jgi:hypothetical protein
MKKTTLAFFVMSMFAASSAMAANVSEASINGFINSMSQSPGSNTTSAINVLGSYGYYFNPQLVGRIVLNEYVMSTSGTTSTTTGMTAVGVGLKYYLSSPAKGAEVFYVFGDLSALGISSTSGNTSTTGSGTDIDVGVGVASFITETVSFDLDIKSDSQAYTLAGYSITNSGVQFDFGITARF